MAVDDSWVLSLDELTAEQLAQDVRPLWSHLRLLLLQSDRVEGDMLHMAGPHKLLPVFSTAFGSKLRMIEMRVCRHPGLGIAALNCELQTSSSYGLLAV